MYIQKESWGIFSCNGSDFDLTHLDEYHFSVNDGDGVARYVLVTFSDHCFTKDAKGVCCNVFNYDKSSRVSALFCPDRYRLSLDIRAHISRIVSGHVWIADGDNCALLPSVTNNGERFFYGIFFELEKLSGLPFDLHMRVKSAYLMDSSSPTTYGRIRFSTLVSIVKAGRRAQKDHKKDRKRPILN